MIGYMRAMAVVLVAALFVAGARAAGAAADDVPAAPRSGSTLSVQRTKLANGLTVLVHEDRSVPVVSTYLFYRSGSRNERPGRTGIAHLFEHMMFNGGTHTEGKFDEVIETNGGSTNGYTTRDFTAYMESFPVPALERVLWIEADRMRALAITPKNLEQERGIVKEERRLRIDDDRVQVYGTTAVMTYHYRTNERYRGEDQSGDFRFLRVFVKRDGRWQMVAGQETAVH